MSLQLAAQHLASKGRGNDSRLIHISPNELKGLQAIARAKGGSLTINPETGLPEAGFLEDILPVAATAATMAFFPAAAPALGGMFGASGALATGLGAGLMAGGFNLLGQAIGGQGINFGKALTSGAITGATAGALQGLGAYTPTADVATKTAATTTTPLTAAQAIDATPAFAYTPSGEMVSSAYPASVTGAVNTAGVVPPPPAGVGPAASTALTGGQKLALGLGGVGALSLLGSRGPKLQPFQPGSAGQIRPYEFTATPTMATPYPSPYTYDSAGLPVTNTTERKYFDMGYTALPPYNAAKGGLMYAYGGPVERMSAMDQQRGMYPQGMIDKTYYATPTQRPASMEIVRSDYDTPVNPMTGLQPMGMAMGGDVEYNLGGYSDGGRLLKGPGDGVSDDIPAMIGKKQPARLADGEFVIPARIVSEIGNGSTDAGARRLYAMMDRVQAKRQKSAKKGKFAMNTKAEKELPA
jgi:hypothetical protein